MISQYICVMYQQAMYQAAGGLVMDEGLKGKGCAKVEEGSKSELRASAEAAYETLCGHLVNAHKVGR